MKRETNVARRTTLAVASALLALTIPSCGPLTLTRMPGPTTTPFPTTEIPPTETATPVPTAQPTPTATSPPTEMPPTPIPSGAVCPPPGSPQLVQPAHFEDYPVAVQQFLSAGGDVETLRDELARWDALPDGDDQVVATDLTGDQAEEVVVALADPDAEMIIRPGVLLILGCQEGAYVILHQEGYEHEIYDWTVRLIQVSDTNLNGRPDVVYTLSSYGAHTCYDWLRILGWDGTAFVNLMGGTLEMPYPTYTVTPGRIEAQSGGIGSVGAEPQRGYMEIWEWNGSVFTVTEEIYEPPVYRYHALLDGDRALLDGDYDTAIETYRRVINDDTLREWGEVSGMMSPAEERAQLAAFARWRLVLTHLLMDRLSDAQAAHNRLQADYPAGAAGHDVAAMAETFWTAYLAEGHIADGCAEVVAMAEAGSSVLDFFNQNYGYANPWWEPEDLCPFE